MSTIDCGAAPAVRGWRLSDWAARVSHWRARTACRETLAELPADLRADVGFDGGLPLVSAALQQDDAQRTARQFPRDRGARRPAPDDADVAGQFGLRRDLMKIRFRQRKPPIPA